MSVIVKIMGPAAVGFPDAATDTPHDNRYLVSWNPHTEAGVLECTSTDDPKEAREFSHVAEVLREYYTVSNVQGVRPWDGGINRPLTGMHLILLSVQPGQNEEPADV